MTRLPHPGIPGEEFQEVIFSDDRRLFGLAEPRLADLVDKCVDLAVWSGRTANPDKLKLFKVTFRDARLALGDGILALCMGEVKYSKAGLKMVGVRR